MKKTLITILIILILASVGYFVGKKSFDNNALKNDTVSDSYTEKNTENTNLPSEKDKVKDVEKVEVKYNPIQDTVNTKITTTYMCDDKVKIVHEQDSPSLPPRISYIRVRDNAGIAYYGDMGAYIRPEYFSIDRAQIEQGYSFNEINFCKYLKN